MKFRLPLWPFRAASPEVAEESSMGFLREEGGQLLILSQPSGGVAGSPMRVPPKEARVPPVPQVRRAATQHCRFFCRWCGALVLLAHDRIGLPFGAPNLRKVESRTVAAVCGSCNHVNNFSLFRGGLGFDTRHGLVQADPRVEPVLIDWLQCQEANCEFPLPLFLLPPEPLSVEVVRDLAMTWHWNELACPAGHRVLAPLWVFGRAPYRFPDPIR